MTRMVLQRGRSLFALLIGSGLVLAAGSSYAGPTGTPLLIDDYEAYADTDDLRAVWSVLDPTRAVVDLECGSPDDWDVSHCQYHGNLGPAAEGAHYMSIRYLEGTAVARMAWSGSPDWSDFKWISVYYRGEPYEQSDLASMQIQLIANGGSDVLSSPVLPGVTQCDPNESIFYCDWSVYDWNVQGWTGLSNVGEMRITVTTGLGEGNGRLFIDSIMLGDVPVPVDRMSWGSVKAMYR